MNVELQQGRGFQQRKRPFIGVGDERQPGMLEHITGVRGERLGCIIHAPLGDQQTANTTTTDVQDNVEIATTPTGESIVVWESRHTGSREVYAQLYDAAGNTVGGEFRINQTTTGSQYDPAVDVDDAGNFVVIWRDSRSGDVDIYARTYWCLGCHRRSHGLL